VNVLEIPSGVLADVVGRKRTMLIAFAGYLASFALFYLAGSFPVFLVAAVVFAVGEAFRTGTHKAMIMAHLASRGLLHLKSHYYGRTRSWSQLGAAVSALIAAAVVFASRSYAEVLLASMVPYALDALLIASYPTELDRPARVGSVPAAGRGRVDGSLRRAFGETGRELARAVSSPGIALTVTNASLFGGFYKAAKDFLQPMVYALTVSIPALSGIEPVRGSAVLIGVVYSALYLLTSVAARQAGALGDRFGSLGRALNAELAAGLAAVLGAGLAQAVGLSGLGVGLFLLVFLVQNARRPLSVTFMSDAVSERIQATALSVESQAQSLFGAAFAFAIGAIADIAGGRIGVGLAAVAALALLLFPLYRLRERPA
jgi:MFS family permease